MNWLRQVWVLVTAVSVLTAGLLVPAFAATEGSWSDPLKLSGPGNVALNPDVGVSADGKTIATTWSEYDGSDSVMHARTSTDGGSTWEKARNVFTHDGFATGPQIAISGDGKTMAITWSPDEGPVQVTTSTDSGNTWTLHTLSGPANQDGAIPRVGVSADGRTIATTWNWHDGSNWIVRAKISTDSGSTWAVVQDLSAPGQNAGHPQVGVSADGRTIATTWGRSDGSNYITQAAISTDNGKTWTTHNLSAPGGGAHAPQVGISADGKTIATTWHRYDGSNEIVQAKTSTDSGGTWNTTHNLSTPGQDADRPQLGISADGKTIATTWGRSDGSHQIVQARVSTDRGKIWTATRNQSASDQSAGEPQVDVSGDGETIATIWCRSDSDGSDRIVQAKTSADSGSTWNTTQNLSAPGQHARYPRVGVSADGETIATTWAHDDGSHSVVQSSIYPAPPPVAPSAASYTPLKRDRTRVR